MTRELLSRFGEALFGAQWQEPLARALGVSGRSVRYWLAGRYAIPPGIDDELRELLRQEGPEIKRQVYAASAARVALIDRLLLE